MKHHSKPTFCGMGRAACLTIIIFTYLTNFIKGDATNILETGKEKAMPVPLAEEKEDMDDVCVPCEAVATCFSADGCAARDIITKLWNGKFGSCNNGAANCGKCFPNSSCAVESINKLGIRELGTAAPVKVEEMRSFSDNIEMIIFGMDREMNDGAISAWKDSTAEYIKDYFYKWENEISSLDVALIFQQQKFVPWDRRNLRSLNSNLGKLVISYKQDNLYVTSNMTEMGAEILSKEPFATNHLRKKYMNTLRATSVPAFSSLISIEMADTIQKAEGEKGDMKLILEENVSEEGKTVDTNDGETRTKSGLIIVVSVFVCVLLLLTIAVCCGGRSKEKDIRIIFTPDKLDMSITSIRFDKSDVSRHSEITLALDKPENVKRKPLVIYAPPGPLGVTIDDTSGEPVIYSINKKSPLVNEIIKGDVLLAIDDEDITMLNAVDVSDLFIEKSKNKTRKLKINRIDE